MSDEAKHERDERAFEVIVAGAGPCGLVLALELGRRGIQTLVVNDRAGTSPHPQANATQARTMEHFRRLGVAERVRAAGLPEDYQPDVAYFTRFLDYELARMSQPAAAETAELARASETTASVAELPHRASQMYVERILREQVDTLPSVQLRFNSEVTGFEDHADHVSVRVQSHADAEEQFTARYLVGCDGARSRIRGQLGIRYGGTRDTDRPFLAGAMYSIHFRSEEVYGLIPHPTAWQYWAVNPERRGLMIALDGSSTFVLATQLREGEDAATLTDDAAREIVHRAMGRPFALDIVSRSPWTAGLTLVADRFGAGNVFLGGDAAHLFTPTGGLGYNTAVEDAVNLGWKLAAALRGWGGERLLASYELERKPVAERNTSFARTLAQSIGGFEVPSEIEDASGAGAAARTEIGDYLAAHARSEFNIPGITLGARYDDTELIIPDGGHPPDQAPGHYEPTACPGGRAPHAWLSDGSSLYDTLGEEFTLLKLGGPADGEAQIVAAASRQQIPLTVRDLTAADLRDLYEADLALVRPDQVVCWRGSPGELDADAVLRRITGW